MEKLRTAVIGAGRMGDRHIQAVQGLDSLQMVAVCDLSLEALKTAVERNQLGDVRLYTDSKKMFGEQPIDFIVIATTAPTHAELTVRAASAGVKHILCEKPMAVSIADCDRMIEVCQQYGSRLAINHQRRYMPRVIKAKEIIDDPNFGGLSSLNVIAGNLGMAMNGIHSFELLSYLTGDRIQDVTGWFSPDPLPNPRGGEFEDRSGSVLVRTAGGKRLYLEIGEDQGVGMLTVYMGRSGRLVIDEISGSCKLTLRKASHSDLPTMQYMAPVEERSLEIGPLDIVSGIRALITGLLSGSGYPTGEDARLAVAILVAAYISSENGHRPIRLEEASGHRERKFKWA